ncbi:MAG: zf-HC2 domain-containing protein [Chloroflexota bacterium]|nr:zf-HC2 domain-containing protein [Chloroflexota bacterium]
MVAEVARRRDCLAGHDEGMLKTYLDGQLPEAWRESMETHVRDCVACKDRLARLRLDGALVHGRLQALEPAAGGVPGMGGSAINHLAEGAAQAPSRPAVGVLLARARRPEGWRERATTWWGDWAPAAARASGMTTGARTPAGVSAAGSSPAGFPSYGTPSYGARRSAWRPLPLAAGAAAGVALVLGVAATQPTMQSFAQGALQQFRVQQVRPVQIDLAALRNLPPIDHSVAEAFFRSGTFSGLKDPKVSMVEPAAANRATGLTLRGIGTLPPQLASVAKGKPTILVSEPASFTFTYDAQKLSQVAQEVGVKDAAVLAQLQSINGVTVKGDIPAAAAVLYGNPFPDGIPSAAGTSGALPGASGAARGTRPLGALATPGAGTKSMAKPTGPAMVFVQLKSPSVSVPKDVNVDQLREQVLKAGVESGAVPLALANELRMIDLQTTLPIPVTTGKATQVPVDGVTGTLVTGESPGPVLIWQKGGAVYLLGGVQVSEADVLAAARNLPTL